MTRQFRTVQVLRAVAALLVVSYHAIEVWNLRVARGGQTLSWQNASAGVDIFFVISGLVMVLSSQHLIGRSNGWRVFMAHRLLRILPLYWLATLLKLATIVLLPSLAMRTRLDWPYVMASFLLIPVHDAVGDFSPVLPVGWTLSFEMLFYLLFATALALRIPALKFVTPILGLGALLFFVRSPAWPAISELADPILLEFVFGAAIATLVLRDRKVPPRVAAALLIAGFAVLLFIPSADPVWRLLGWGLPATAIVAGTVGLEPVVAKRLPGWALELGDASYAIYLTHGFVLPAFGVALARLHFGNPVVVIGAGIVASALVGVAVHRAIERSMIAKLKDMVRKEAVLF